MMDCVIFLILFLCSIIDSLITRCPGIAEEIFQNLDIDSLEECRSASNTWRNFIDLQKFYWAQITEFHSGWDLTLSKVESQKISILGSAFLRLTEESLADCHPMFCAIAQDNVELLQEMLDLFPNYQSLKITLERKNLQPFNFQPFHFAAFKGHLNIVKYFMTFDDPNPRGHNSWTPLHFAVFAGQSQVVRVLLSQVQGDKNLVYEDFDREGETLLHYAARRGHLEVVEILFENISGEKNPKRKDGWTPLHWAARESEFEIAKLILENTDDKNPPTNHDWTPLHSASQRFHSFKIVQLLLENIQNKNPPCKLNGNTPLHIAVESHNSKVALLLLSQIQGDKNPRNYEG